MQSTEEEFYFNKAINSLKDKKYKESFKYFNEVLILNPRNANAYYNIGNILYYQGNINKSITAFTRALEINDKHTDAAIALSIIYNDIGQYNKGQAIFKSALNKVKYSNNENGLQDNHVNKLFSQKHLELAELYFSYHRFEEAIHEYQKSALLDQNNIQSRLGTVKAMDKKGLKSKATDELKKLMNEFPGSLEIRLNLGIIYYSQGKVIEAQNEWQKILDRQPDHPQAIMYMKLSKEATETTIEI